MIQQHAREDCCGAGRRCVVLCSVILMMPGCEKRGGDDEVSIRLIVPDRFHGEIKLVVDADKDTVPDGRKSGEFVYVIPPSGTMYIRDAAPFHQWHTFVGQFSGGARLAGSVDPEENDGKEYTSGAIGIWGGETITDGESQEIRYFVGSHEDYEKYRGWKK